LGLAQIQQRRPDLVFLDLTMPGLSGFGVIAQLKQDPATRDIPVVVVTSQVLDEAQTRELASNAVAVLSKEALGRAESLDVTFGPPVSVMARYAPHSVEQERLRRS
jgi:CheY-like chemotaxis protein